MANFIKREIGNRVSSARLKTLRGKLKNKDLTEKQRRFLINQINKLSNTRYDMMKGAKKGKMTDEEYKLRRENILSRR